MKRLIVLTVMIVLVFGLSSCNDQNEVTFEEQVQSYFHLTNKPLSIEIIEENEEYTIYKMEYDLDGLNVDTTTYNYEGIVFDVYQSRSYQKFISMGYFAVVEDTIITLEELYEYDYISIETIIELIPYYQSSKSLDEFADVPSINSFTGLTFVYEYSKTSVYYISGSDTVYEFFKEVDFDAYAIESSDVSIDPTRFISTLYVYDGDQLLEEYKKDDIFLHFGYIRTVLEKGLTEEEIISQISDFNVG